MTALPFRPDRKLTDFLAENPFTLSAEVIPPRNGNEQDKVFEQIRLLVCAGAQFIAVTKGAGGSLRGGSLPIAQAVKETFNMPVVAHFTCRDLVPAEVESHLVDHHYFGIRNILALRGDPPDGQADWKPREGGHAFAHQLIRQIAELNQGRFLPRPGGPATDGSESTDFCIGAAAYAEFPDPIKRAEYFRLKIEAGAHYGVTDMLFDPEIYARFRDQCVKAGVNVPILPGTRILKSREQALKMIQRFRVTVPQDMFDTLPETKSAEGLQRGVELFLRLSDRLRSLGAPGIHLFVISDTPAAVAGLHHLAHVLRH